MKNKRTSVISIVLAVVLTVSMMPVFSFAGIEEPSDNFNYVALGASNVNGFGLRGYMEIPTDSDYDENSIMEAAALDYNIKNNATGYGYKATPAGCYPVLLQAQLATKLQRSVHLDQLAMSSMRIEELRYLLDDSYNGDKYTEWRFVNDSNNYQQNPGWFDIADGTADKNCFEIKNCYRDAIANADLITLDFGVNNFGVYLINILTEGPDCFDTNINLINDKLGANYKKLKQPIESLLKQFDIDLDQEDFDDYVDALVYALVGYCYNFDRCIECIYDLNSDVDIVVVDIQNLLAGVKLDLNGIKLPLGDMMGALINIANAYTAAVSPYAGTYYYADVRKNGHVEFFLKDIANYEDLDDLSVNLRDCFDVLEGFGDPYSRGIHIKWQLYSALYDKYKEEETMKSFVNEVLGTTDPESKETPESAETPLDNAEEMIEPVETPLDEEIQTVDYANGTEQITKVIKAGGYEGVVDGCLPEGVTIKSLLDVAYDTYAKILSAGAKLDTVSIDLLDGVEDATDALENGIKKEIKAAVDQTINKKPYTFAGLDSFFASIISDTENTGKNLSLNALKSAGLIGVRTQIGNSFFSHPNMNGHQEIAEIVMNSYTKRINGKRQIQARALKSAARIGAVIASACVTGIIVKKALCAGR